MQGTHTGFAKAGVQCFYDSEVGNQSFVHLINFCAEIPRPRKARTVSKNNMKHNKLKINTYEE